MKLNKVFLIIILVNLPLLATARFVSKTGSDTPPYTTWSTASPNLQKVINYCSYGDTIYIGTGIFTGNFEVPVTLTFIGIDCDSSILRYGNGIKGIKTDLIILNAMNSIFVKNLTLDGNNTGYYSVKIEDVNNPEHLLYIENCNIIGSSAFCSVYGADLVIKNSFLRNFDLVTAISHDDSYPDSHFALIESNVILPSDKMMWAGVSRTIFRSNLVKPQNAFAGGIFFPWSRDYAEFSNNIFQFTSATGIKIENIDTVRIFNNTFVPYILNGYWLIYPQTIKIYRTESSKAYNNIFYQCEKCIYHSPQTSNTYTDVYNNLFYDCITYTTGGNINLLGGNIYDADPMFENDNFDNDYDEWDVHLQYASPAIDAGFAGLSDPDGSISDMGAFGGPNGIMYKYKDLPPKPVVPDTIVFNLSEAKVKLAWQKNTESDLAGYNIHRGLSENFLPKNYNKIAFTDTNCFEYILADSENKSFYYKVKAVDQTGNLSPVDAYFYLQINASPLTGVNSIEREYDYKLEQNYPNPFNPTTTISFTLREECNVKIKIYDTNGQLIEKLTEQFYAKGRHEVEFNGENLSSGIYLYRIEALNSENIPIFFDMGKMVLIK
ncbi:MAG: hypothetical protein SCALA702_00970 [Melioribacteraceae bacterium]|nr:MAG: hypothetical protein SCALA702_00970 [Melioribacteraceae bacterium]